MVVAILLAMQAPSRVGYCISDTYLREARAMKYFERMVCALAFAFIGPLSATAWAACPFGPSAVNTLTLSTLPELLGSGQLAFEIDDEGLNPTPLYLDMPVGQPNTSTGAFTGFVATSTGPGAPTYPVTGMLTQVLDDGLSVTFSYSPGTNANGVIEGGSYTYNGAIALEQSQCNLFMAGVYTANIHLKIPVTFPFHPVTNPISYTLVLGPFPFSAKAVQYFSQ
jgi:hypothetical protein